MQRPQSTFLQTVSTGKAIRLSMSLQLFSLCGVTLFHDVLVIYSVVYGRDMHSFLY
jgi:hypothetical protein